ncbi:MAG: ABC transporter permease [Pirellulaceae bacterium]
MTRYCGGVENTYRETLPLGAEHLSFPELSIAIRNTLMVSALSLLVAIPLGIAVALFLYRTNLVARRFGQLAIGSQLAVPLYVLAGGWSAAFGLQGWLRALGISFGDGQPGTTSGLMAVALIHGLAALPWVTLLIGCGLMRTDRGLEDQARMDGGTYTTLTRTVLPRLFPWIAAASAFCLLPVFTEMVVSNLFQIATVTEQVYLDASRGTLKPLTYIASTLLCVVPMVILFLGVFRMYPELRSFSLRDVHHEPQALQLGKGRWPFSGGIWVLFLCIIGVPIFSLVVKAGWLPFTDDEGQTGYGWSPSRFASTVQEAATLFQPEIFWSLMLALSSVALAVAITVAVQCFRNRHVKSAFSALMIVLIATPGPLVGLFVIWVLNRSEPAIFGYLYDQTLAAPMLAQQFRILPMAWLFSHLILNSVSSESTAQAELDGVRGLAYLRYVLWPQTGKLWIAGLILLLIYSIGELSCTILVLPPGVTTLAMRLFEMLHFGMRHQDSGLCGLFILLGWLAVGALWATSAWKTRTDR